MVLLGVELVDRLGPPHVEQVHPEVIDHTPGKHPGMPFERAADYPAQTGEELAHPHGD